MSTPLPVISSLDLSIVVVTKNNVEMTAQLFASIAQTSDNLKYEIVVVDMGSVDATVSFVGSHGGAQVRGAAQGNAPKKVSLLHNPGNNVAASWNMGIAATRGRHILVADTNAVFGTEALSTMIRTAESDDTIGAVLPLGPDDVDNPPLLVQPAQRDTRVSTIVQNLDRMRRWSPPADAAALRGELIVSDGCFLLKRSAYESAGPFDERYNTAGTEYDFFLRLRSGRKLVRCGAYVHRIADLVSNAPEPEIDVSVVVTTFNKLHFTVQFLASLCGMMERLTYEVIVVDNGSTDGTVEWAKAYGRGNLTGAHPPARVRVLFNAKKRNLARSWNMGVDVARGRAMLICNNDVLFTRESVQRMLAVAESSNTIGLVMPLAPLDVDVLRQPRLGVVNPCIGDDVKMHIAENLAAVERWRNSVEFPDGVTYIGESFLKQGGYAFMIPRRTFMLIGRFDETYGFSSEDWDYFDRVRRHMKIARHDGAYVHHYEHQSWGELPKGESAELFALSRFLLTEKVQGVKEYFSIVMPTYNRSHALYAAIDSVLAQTFREWRLYVVDDGSSNWPAISRELFHRYYPYEDRVRFFPRERNQGPAAARNYAMSIARGKYIAFLDSDDEWHPDHLQRHFDAHESGNYAMVYSDPEFAWRKWDERFKEFVSTLARHPTIDYFGEFSAELLKQKCFIQTSSVSVWRPTAQFCRFPEEMRVEEDWSFFQQVADCGEVYHLPHKTCRYNFTVSKDDQPGIIRTLKHDLNMRGSEFSPTKPRLLLDRPVTGSVGVVVPTKERPCCLPRAIASAGDVPVVVVDDGSLIASEALDISRKSATASLLRFDASVGASAARNVGAAHLRTEWIQFLDDDDLLAADWIARMRPHFIDGVDVIIGSAFVPSERGLGVSSDIFTSQICMRRSVFEEVGGFRESLSWAEERDIIDRLTARGARIVREFVPHVYRPSRGGSGDPDTAKLPAAAAPSSPGRRIVGRFGGRD